MKMAPYLAAVAIVASSHNAKPVGASLLAMFLPLPVFARKLAPTASSLCAQHITGTWV
ncbi:exported hypothetical protein [Pseudomonas sp. 8AS]|nr:exported hypothetical protein [Pseudomonas sp. 8AS]